MTDRSKQFWMENMFRPIFEFRMAQAWLLGAFLTLAIGGFAFDLSQPIHLGIFLFMLLNACIQAKQGFPLLRRQMHLFTNYFYTIKADAFREQNLKDQEKVNLGKGFKWGPEHAQRAYQVMSMTSDYLEINRPLLLRPMIRKSEETTRKLGGAPWIQGVGEEKVVTADASIFHAHSVIFGNPGTGKTTLLGMFSSAALHRGNVLIIVDPKNDSAWRKRIEIECKELGMSDKFYFFHPSHPSHSCRIDPMTSYVRTTELASRITSVMSGESGSDPFVDFAWKTIHQVIEACIYAGIKPQLENIGYYLMAGKGMLTNKCLRKYFDSLWGPDWESNKGEQIKKMGQGSMVDGMCFYYANNLKEDDMHPAISGIVEMYMHPQEHMSKMLSSTAPLFEQLNSTPLNELLSPKLSLDEKDDERPLVNIDNLVHTGGVLYLSLDSLSDSVVASAVGKLILSDICAASAKRYNYEEGEGRRVSIFVDEAHACINDPLIQMLAVARGAKFELYVSSQTLPDYIAKLGEAPAKRILGLASNLFCLRVNDDVTQEYATTNFSTAYIKQVGFALNSGTSTTGNIGEFSGGVRESLSTTKENLFPATLLGDLPNLQYIARLADGRKIKGRIPFLQ